MSASTAIWLAIGVLIGLMAGWAWTTWRLDRRMADALDALRDEGARRCRDLIRKLEESEKRNEVLSSTIDALQAKVVGLGTEAKEQTREIERAEARVFDRESTIDALRSKLYASRNRAAELEREVEILRTQLEELGAEPLADSQEDSLSSIVVDLGETLSVDRD